MNSAKRTVWIGGVTGTGAAIRRLGGEWTGASASPAVTGKQPPRQADGGFAICIRSWREQREYIGKAAPENRLAEKAGMWYH